MVLTSYRSNSIYKTERRIRNPTSLICNHAQKYAVTHLIRIRAYQLLHENTPGSKPCDTVAKTFRLSTCVLANIAARFPNDHLNWRSPVHLNERLNFTSYEVHVKDGCRNITPTRRQKNWGSHAIVVLRSKILLGVCHLKSLVT
jgi:hypothetical protein